MTRRNLTESQARARLLQFEAALKTVKTCQTCGHVSNLDGHIGHMLEAHGDAWNLEIAKCEEEHAWRPPN